MEKAYIISDIKFANDYLILMINNQLFQFKLADISVKLSNATDQEREDFKVSPSGYGIHWRLIDEDLSINGLLKVPIPKHTLHRV